MSKLSFDYLLYPWDGDSYGKIVYGKSFKKFCNGPMKGAEFTIRELMQAAPNVMFLRGSLKHPSFKTPGNRILFSEGISVKLVRGSYKIYREVRSTFRLSRFYVSCRYLTHLTFSSQREANCRCSFWKIGRRFGCRAIFCKIRQCVAYSPVVSLLLFVRSFLTALRVEHLLFANSTFLHPIVFTKTRRTKFNLSSISSNSVIMHHNSVRNKMNTGTVAQS